MKRWSGLLLAAVAAAVVMGWSSSAALAGDARSGHAVFVQTDDPAGNVVVAYHRAADGTLTQAGAYPTGGAGGVLAGSVVDHLASQGSLVYDDAHRLLFAVNAGSNTVSVFSVRGERLSLNQVVGSGGRFPVSIAVSGNRLAVLNALDGGSVQSYAIVLGHLLPLPGSRRALGLDPSATPQFTTTPGQVAFTPDGSRLIVTTKANGNDIDVFAVGPLGYLSARPVVNAEPGTVPFAVAFDRAGDLVVAEAGTNAVATYELHNDGTLDLLDRVATGQAATCWISGVGDHFFASNAGSGSLSDAHVAAGGQLALVATTTADPGTVDSAATPDGRFLYVQTGAQGIVDEFRIEADGTLTAVGAVTVPDAVGAEGIAAS
jgi:6-phosphogluconolactonase (cycloisomerase 2 family)